MHFIRRFPVKAKLALAILGTTAVSLLVACSLFVIHEVMTFRQSLIGRVTVLADVLALSSTAALDFDEHDRAKEILDGVAAEKSIIAAGLYASGGEIFAKYSRTGSKADVPVVVSEDGPQFKLNRLLLFRPVFRDKERIGTIGLVASSYELKERLRGYATISILVLAGSLGLAAALAYVLQRTISKPIHSLAATAMLVSKHKDYSVRTVKETEDELGQLADSFNQMLAQIQERDDALRRAHDELELRVKERTAELAQANESLKTLEERSRLIIETANDAFIAIDSTSTIMDWNRQAEVTFGWRREEVIGKSLVEAIIPLQLREAHKRGLGHFLATGQGPVLNKRVELSALHRDGHEFPVEVTIWPIRLGEEHRFNAFVHDITERKQAEEALAQKTRELEAVNKELGQFAYVASHDLQEPLRMIVSYLQLLDRRYRDKLDDDGRQFLNFAVDGGQRMQTLIHDLLAFSRVGTRKKAFESVDLNGLVRSVLANLKVAISESGASITQDALPTINGDLTQLAQLFQNLINNGIKFRGKEPPRIHISAARGENEWCFGVRDNGIGIDPQYFERIFAIFQRLHTRDEYPGTGIGLAVCKKVVERHGGRIWVESEPGKGANFCFTIADVVSGES